MRLLVLGAPGSGKTTLARALSGSLELPHVELDSLNFDRGEGWMRVAPYDDRVERARALAGEESWICDGNYLGWTRSLMCRAELIVYLRCSVFLALGRVVRRHAVLSARGENPYPSWRRLGRFCYYIAMQHMNRLEPYTAQDLPVGPASTVRELACHEHKVLCLPARMYTRLQVGEVHARLPAQAIRNHDA